MPCESVDVKLYIFEHNSGYRKISVEEEAGNYKEDHKKLCAVYFMGLN